METNLNLCEEILKEAKRLNLKESGINTIQGSVTFIDAYHKSYALQRSMLTTLLFKILISSDFQPPAQIRIALNSANDINSWLDDVKVVILPFIKANEDKYFPG